MRQREHYVDVRHIQQFLFTVREPSVTSVGLAFSAMAVPTRVVGDGLLAAAGALIHMAAERGRAAALDSPQHPKMLPGQSGSILLDKTSARCANDVGHLEGWRVHLLCSLRERFTCSGFENWALSMGVPAAFR